MIGFGYAAGERWGIAAQDTVLVLAPGTPPEVVSHMLATLRSGAGTGTVLGALAAASGADLLALPSFALLTTRGGVGRLVLRGLDASVGGSAKTGIGVLTWTEHEVPADASVRIGAGGAVSPALEVADGVVRCAAIEVSVAARAAPAVPTPQPQQPVRPPAPPAAALTVAAAASSAVQDPPLDSGATLHPTALEPVEPATPSTAAAGELTGTSTSQHSVVRSTTGDQAPSGVEAEGDLTGLTDLLGGHTVIRSIADAARWPGRDGGGQPQQEERSAVAEPDSDHDGLTMLRSELQSDGQVGLRTAVGSIWLADGRSWTVDRPVVIGRRPQASRVSAGELPHLVTVDSPGNDISRNHVEIRPQGTHAVVTDLGTTNGTTLRRPGKPPQRLVANDRHVLADQDVVDLGDGVLVTFAAERAGR